MTAICDDSRIQILNNTVTIGDVDMDGNFEAEISLTSDYDIIGGTVFHINLALNTGAYTTPYEYSFAVGVAVETFESGDFSFLEWEHAGDHHWFITDDEVHSGTYSARSGEIADDEASYLRVYADILIDGEISFWFKTSTEPRKDLFAFFMDGRKKDWWSGENDWTFVSYDFEAGSHVFEWIYDKNHNGQAGHDCAWIDDITFPRGCVITGIEEVIVKKGNVLYPNPTTGCFSIALEKESNIVIFNALGQPVKHLDKVAGCQQVNLENAPKGMYFVRIQSGDNLEVKKLIVE